MQDNQEDKRSDKDELAVFDFTEAEARVLRALLEVGPSRVSKLSREADVPRTTAYHVLLRLKERGMVRKISKGHFQRYWAVVRSEKLKRVVRDDVSDLLEYRKESPAKQKEIVGGIDAKEIGIQVFRGKRQIQKAYEAMLDLSKTERVFAIQGNRSAGVALEKLEKAYLFDFHKSFKKARIIMESINGEYVLDLFKKLDIEALVSHLDRTLIVTLLPDRYMDFNMDILVFRDIVLFINIQDELVVFVRYKPIVAVFRHICILFQESGRSIKLNDLLRKLIEEKKKA